METAIREAIQGVLKKLGIEPVDFAVEHPADLSHGDYATNVAMALSKRLGKNPRELAEQFCTELGGVLPEVAAIEIAGPGFINFRLSRNFFSDAVARVRTFGDAWGKNDSWAGKKVVVEYTDPNPFKEFHVGHLFTNAVGESIARLFMMNGADEVLYSRGQSHAENLGDGSLGLSISSRLGPLIYGGMTNAGLHVTERIGWWGHIMMVFAFLNYLPKSKHLHVLLAFPTVYFSNLKAKVQFTNLFEVTDVVKPNFDPAYQPVLDPNAVIKFGVKDVTDLTWKNLLDAYSCTECGRCTSACPQNITGKALSPRKIMMDTRDRLEEVGKNIDKNGGTFVDDGKTLLGDYIKHEEIWACNTCNACVQECPVNIDPLAIIVGLRQQLVLEQSSAPNELNGMFSNLENNGAPWQFSPADRANWIHEQ